MTATMTAPSVGDELAVREHKPLTRSDIVRYAGASGDFNPIHHDESFATSVGFPTVFSIGMYQAALLANFAADAFGPANVRRVTLRFSAQVWPGDVLTCSGSVTRVEETADGTEVEVDLSCARRGEDGSEAVAVAGSAAFLLP